MLNFVPQCCRGHNIIITQTHTSSLKLKISVLTTVVEANSTSQVGFAAVAQVKAIAKGAILQPGFVACAVHTAHPEGSTTAE